MRIASALSIWLFLQPALALAQDLPASLRMLTGWWTDRGTHMAAFEITLADGWKTYWRAPGDAGIPPSINWQGSRNLGAATLHWPRPDIFDAFGARTIGYADRLVLPVELKPADGAGSVRVAGQIELGVCEDVCVPMGFAFDIELPTRGERQPDIAAALDRVPPITSGRAVSGLSCAVAPLSDGLRITAELGQGAELDASAAVFEHRNREIWISGAELTRNGSVLSIVADFVPPDAQPFALERSDIRLTLIAEDEALEIRGCPSG